MKKNIIIFTLAAALVYVILNNNSQTDILKIGGTDSSPDIKISVSPEVAAKIEEYKNKILSYIKEVKARLTKARVKTPVYVSGTNESNVQAQTPKESIAKIEKLLSTDQLSVDDLKVINDRIVYEMRMIDFMKKGLFSGMPPDSIIKIKKPSEDVLIKYGISPSFFNI